MNALDIRREQVVSSMIKSAGWADNTLVVEFNNGSVYSYHAPQEYFLGMMQAESVGKYFLQHIKPLYAGRKLKDAE